MSAAIFRVDYQFGVNFYVKLTHELNIINRKELSNDG